MHSQPVRRRVARVPRAAGGAGGSCSAFIDAPPLPSLFVESYSLVTRPRLLHLTPVQVQCGASTAGCGWIANGVPSTACLSRRRMAAAADEGSRVRNSRRHEVSTHVQSRCNAHLRLVQRRWQRRSRRRRGPGRQAPLQEVCAAGQYAPPSCSEIKRSRLRKAGRPYSASAEGRERGQSTGSGAERTRRHMDAE